MQFLVVVVVVVVVTIGTPSIICLGTVTLLKRGGRRCRRGTK